jgi:hypothetical protein
VVSRWRAPSSRTRSGSTSPPPSRRSSSTGWTAGTYSARFQFIFTSEQEQVHRRPTFYFLAVVGRFGTFYSGSDFGKFSDLVQDPIRIRILTIFSSFLYNIFVQNLAFLCWSSIVALNAHKVVISFFAFLPGKCLHCVCQNFCHSILFRIRIHIRIRFR